MQTNAKTNVSFQIDDITYNDGFLTMNIIIGDACDDIEEAEMSVPVEDLGDGEWAADDTDTESQELEAIAMKLGIQHGQLLTSLARTGFEAWCEGGSPTDHAINPGIGCAVDLPVAAEVAAEWKASVLIAA